MDGQLLHHHESETSDWQEESARQKCAGEKVVFFLNLCLIWKCSSECPLFLKAFPLLSTSGFTQQLRPRCSRPGRSVRTDAQIFWWVSVTFCFWTDTSFHILELVTPHSVSVLKWKDRRRPLSLFVMSLWCHGGSKMAIKTGAIIKKHVTKPAVFNTA